jgi:hypothetical protein
MPSDLAAAIRRALLAAAAKLADFAGGSPCYSCCGAGLVACPRCSGSGAESLPEGAPAGVG